MSKQLYYFLFVGCILLSCNQEEAILKFDLSQLIGNTFTYSIVHSSRSQFNSHETLDTSFADIQLKVISSNGKQNRMELTFLNLAHRRLNRDTASTNSYSEYSHAYDSTLKKTKGKTLDVVVNEKGEVENVNGYDELVATIASEHSMDKRSVYQELHDYASTSAVQDILNRLFAFFPNKAVKVGDNWGNTITMVARAPINFNSLYTLEKISGDSLYLKIESSILGGPSNYQLSGTQSATVVFNKKSHLPYLYSSNSSSTTKTVAYEVQEWDQWLITLRNHQSK